MHCEDRDESTQGSNNLWQEKCKLAIHIASVPYCQWCIALPTNQKPIELCVSRMVLAGACANKNWGNGELRAPETHTYAANNACCWRGLFKSTIDGAIDAV